MASNTRKGKKAAAPASAQKKKNGGKTQKKAKASAKASNLEALEQQKNEGKAQWTLSENTASAYTGQVNRGKIWVVGLAAAQKVAAAAGKAPTYHGKKIDLDELSRAFDEPPNRYSPYALELLLTEKCLVEGKSISTAQSTFSAMKHYWKMMPGGKYRGKWTVDEATGQVSGNPADAPDVQDVLRAITNKTRAAGTPRDHAEAIRIEDMQQMMRWSEKCVSSEVDWTTAPINDTATLLYVAKHLSGRAEMSTGFTLWTRNVELCELQRRHYTQYCTGPGPYYQEFDEILLENRKGWTSANASAPCQGRRYQLYDQPLTPEINAMRHTRIWLAFLETRLLGRPLKPDEYLFPVISSTGLVYVDQPIDHNVMQKTINEFATGAGLTTQFSTHSLRRGGAQYRFMFCPMGERWSLSAIRWWGGWAVGEHADTLVKYLINELTAYETSHTDALSSFRRDASRQFMGNHLQGIPGGTTEELRLAMDAMNRKADRLEDLAVQITAALKSGQTQPALTLSTQPHSSSFVGSFPSPLYSHSQYGPNVPSGSHQPASVVVSGGLGHWQGNLSLLSQNPYGHLPLGYHNPVPLPPNLTQSLSSNEPALPAVVSGQRPKPSVADAVIPKLPRGKKAWKEVIKQWEIVDTRTGLALKDWPDEWYKGEMRLVNGAKYGQRRDIAVEYIRLGSDDAAFVAQYPEAELGARELVEAIRKRHIVSGSRMGRKSKNGTPLERNQSSNEPASVDVV